MYKISHLIRLYKYTVAEASARPTLTCGYFPMKHNMQTKKHKSFWKENNHNVCLLGVKLDPMIVAAILES